MRDAERMTKLERKLRKKETDRIRSLNKTETDLAEEALRVLWDVALVGIGVVAGMYISTARVHAAIVQKNHLSATWQTGAPVVERIPESFPEEIPPEAVDAATQPNALNALKALQAERVGEPHEQWEYLGRWKTTGFCPCRACNGSNAERTASGAPMVPGRTVAVGGLPFGTVLRIGDREYVVEDRGTPYGHIDILYGDHRTASNHGIQYKEVWIKR